MQRYPLDIWQQVIGHLARNSDRDALKAAALLSREITPLAQAELFRDVSLDCFESCESLLDIIHYKPSLAPFIRSLTIYGDTYRLLCPKSLELASYFTRVSYLTMSMIDFDEEWVNVNVASKEANSFFSAFTSVQTLAIESSCFSDVETMGIILTYFRSSLQRLEMSETTWGLGDRPYPSIPKIYELLHNVSSYPAWKLESLNTTEVHISYLAAWLMRCGAAIGIRSLNMDISTDDEDVEAVSHFFSHGCKSLHTLEIRMMFSAQKTLHMDGEYELRVIYTGV
jgi:hypothetical protein